jgi:hypothetical protein
MKSNTFLLSVLPACVLAATQRTQKVPSTPPPEGQVLILSTKTSGPGCDPSKTSVDISSDLTTVTIGMTDMAAYAGPLSPVGSRNRRNCAIHTKLRYPGGYQFSVMTATYNGWAKLESGVIGHLTSTYFFSSNPSKLVYFLRSLDGLQI